MIIGCRRWCIELVVSFRHYDIQLDCRVITCYEIMDATAVESVLQDGDWPVSGHIMNDHGMGGSHGSSLCCRVRLMLSMGFFVNMAVYIYSALYYFTSS